MERSGLDVPEKHYLDLEGALNSIDTIYTSWGQDAEKVETLQSDLVDLINSPIAQLEPNLEIHRTFAIQGTPHEEIQPPLPPQFDGHYLFHADPRLTPPIYGRWHAGKKPSPGKVVDTGSATWIDTLNLDPRHRVAAGLGAEVVRKNQEDLMASAWEQLGTFEQANQLLRNAQLGREVSTCLYQRISTLLYDPKTKQEKKTGKFLRLTTPLFGKILYQPNERATISQENEKQTVAKKLSKTYPARIDPSLRHVLRQRSPIRRRQKSHMFRRVNIYGVVPEQTGTPDDSTSEFNLNAEDIICPSVTPMGTLDGDLVLAYWEQESVENKEGNGSQSSPDSTPPSNPPDSDKDTQNGKHHPLAIDHQLNAEKIFPIADSIFKIIEPCVTIKEHVKSRLKLSDDLTIRFLDDYPGDPLDPIMAAPEFTQAMYEPLRDLSHELLLPGVERIPANTIGLLKVNRRFLESYLCGLNHEFAGELVWRGYPTDQRGSYFRQFWSASEYLPDSAMHTTALNLWLQSHGIVSIADISRLEKERILRRHPEATNNIEKAVQIEADEEYLKDIQQLHEWKNKSTDEYRLLGENAVRKDEELVLVIRGDLLRRYPSALIYAVDATDAVDKENRKILAPKLPEFTNQSGARVFPIFRATLPPDITFFGFPFTLEEACGSLEHGHGKFFVFEERIGEPRFGLDEPPEESEVAKQPETWDDLTWEDFSTLKDEKYVDIEYGDYADNVKNPPTENGKKEWATSSATRAWITMQKPVRRAAHAKQMLPRPCIEGIEPNHGQRGEVLKAMISGQQLTDVTTVTIPGGVETHVVSGGNDKQLPVELDIAWWAWPREQDVTVRSSSGALPSKRPVKFYIRDNPSLKIRMEIQNDFEIILFLEEKAPYFLERLSNLDRYGLLSSKALAASEFDQQPIGTGPFIFKSRRPGDSIQLIRNEKYWGNKAYPDDIFFKFTSSLSERGVN